MLLELFLNPDGIANQNNRNLPLPGGSDRTLNLDAGGIVATHGIDRDNDATFQPQASLFFGSDDIFTLIGATGGASAMRQLGLLALGAYRYSGSQ